ncbi:MAG: type III polyketide synthase [Verrucomicrobia bacterium]|nr:type III polyketide synthase [Verrucomicrobiota bacterium]MCH8511483.1 type III polyketide synthase [Kiritimatiellia bacterium]
MPVHLHAIQTWNPPTAYTQDEASARVEAQFDNKRFRRILRHVYRHSGIETRHSAVGVFGQSDKTTLFHDRGDGRWSNPGTGDRNKAFIEVSKTASVELARKTLNSAPGFAAADITHVITASCTGFYTPGPDYHIVRGLELSPEVERFHLGFMGCYAAFPALRMARSLCQNDPNAVVLIECLELCSLHLQLETDNEEALVSGSLFADGAGCALVSGRPPAPGQNGYELQSLASTLTPNGEDSMAWEIGNHGYEIVLSSYVPQILGDNIRNAILPHLQKLNWEIPAVDFWAAHPGGKAILDQISKALDLNSADLDIARNVLRDYGNMSSATIFFLLQKGLENLEPGPRTAAMAFGPGLTVELALMERRRF